MKRLTHCCYQFVIMDVSDGDPNDLLALKMVCGLELAPVLAISAHDESNHAARILSIADDYMQKPIEVEVCTAKTQAFLRRIARREVAFVDPLIM